MTTLSRIEALLFVAGDEGLTLRQLAELIEIPPSGMQQSLEKLAEKYDNDDDSALCLIETANSFKLVTKERYAELLKAYAHTPVNQSLSRASLETLSIIAYKQPITRIEVDGIRGVNSSGAIGKLQALGLVEEVGKKDVLGRPNLYATTDYFLDFMGINHLEELIDVSTIDIKEEEVALFAEVPPLEE
ncbi:SMC-Scp complex subunit ScpB [Streptococcus pluranimalium]|uniref:SMC-Scp complex subunit ScpB n=1 Tax=Streptococcus hyovaginalis TaxID=149015 RepID=UPI0014792DF0|nr:SMC-Scp complex subunit ScpB [Streptococcus hyovaginalis]MDY3025210.1 SMC-Scp complex subunit ScpB [Streptococcus hyovaginalis]MDY4510375.1 SMC-Scp complex subunit ScpB [Streptococcus hyovaginalis]MDY5973779.1 SMC-Scp complex subunit ScpB [Streptococcus hyovaginalis]